MNCSTLQSIEEMLAQYACTGQEISSKAVEILPNFARPVIYEESDIYQPFSQGL